MFIGINFDLAEFIPTKSGWKHEAVLAALGLGVSGGDSTLTKQAQLSLNEYELDLLRQRSLSARYEKARRGELIVR
jgi:hypothetical protein